MIVVKCPNCGGCFSVAGPPPPLFTDCPSCHKTLRLPRKVTEEEIQRAKSAASKRKWRRRLQVIPVVLAVAGLVGLLYGSRSLYHFANQTLSGSDPAELPVGGTGLPHAGAPRTAHQSQLELARRRGSLVRLAPGKLFAMVSPAVVRVVVQSSGRRSVGQGSGFIISPDGWVITNYHVIEGADTATVVLADYTDLLVAGVGAIDRQSDLALLKVIGRDLPCLMVSTKPPPPVGQKVFAIGSPEGLMNTLSEGLISGHRVQDGVPVVQTTAPVSHGSSGGPLLTAEGLVVGVTSRIRAGGQNLNFAVPAERVQDLLRKQGKMIPLAKLRGDPLKRAVVVQLDQAWKAMEKKDWDRAEAILKPLASVYTDNPFVLFAYGHFHRRQGAYKLAIKAFEAATQLKPDYAEAHYSIGITYCDREALAAIVHDHSQSLDLEKRARRALLKAVRFDPSGQTGRAARAAIAKHWPRTPIE